MANSRIKPTTVLGKQLEQHQWPVYALDDADQLIYLNAACEQITGVPSDQLIGVTAKYHEMGQLSDVEQAAASLCPPPEAERAGPYSAVIDFSASPNKPTATVWNASFFPLMQQNSNQQGTLAVLVPQEIDTRTDVNQNNESDALHNALRAWRLSLRSKYSTSRLVGVSEAMQRVRKQVAASTQSLHPVVIYGPSGSGREHVARSICYAPGAIEAGPVISIRCALMDAELITSTVRAFYHRCSDEQGEHPASLLLLEAEQLPSDAQTALYHLLNEKNQELRIVTTARESLLSLATHGTFREDLAYRLSTFEIALPPLCDRPEDIPILTQSILEEKNLEQDPQKRGFDAAAIDLMLCHHWPGNIDELIQFVDQACEESQSPTIRIDDLPNQLHHAISANVYAQKDVESINLDEFLLEVELELISGALKQSGGNKTKAAKMLGISRARLHRRLEKPAEKVEESMFKSLDD
ncbi:MAG: sigma-54-dependent transcriptional regulator [Pirellulales bacterium]